jgi:hypothetical protein
VGALRGIESGAHSVAIILQEPLAFVVNRSVHAFVINQQGATQ